MALLTTVVLGTSNIIKYNHEELKPRINYKVCPSFLPQNAVVSFKELCGLSSVANLMQCMVAVSPRFLGPDNAPLVVLNLSEQYPTMELQGIVPEVLKKIVTTYDTVSRSVRGRSLRERGVKVKLQIINSSC